MPKRREGPNWRQEIFREAVEAYHQAGSKRQAAINLGIPRSTLQDRLKRAKELGIYVGDAPVSHSSSDKSPPPAPEPLADLLSSHISNTKEKERRREEKEEMFLRMLGRACTAFSPPQKIYHPGLNYGYDEHVAILNLSDFHTGEVVRKEEIDGLNSFDRRVLASRLELLTEKVINLVELQRTHARIEKLIIWWGGDMTSGVIHEELQKNADIRVMEQPAYAGWLLACIAWELSAYFEEVLIKTSVGNHGRLKPGKPEFKSYAVNSYDWIAYQMAAFWLRDIPNIKVEITPSVWCKMDVLGWRILWAHGHFIKGWAGIPFYGMQRELGNAQRRNVRAGGNIKEPVKPIHYYILAHFHPEAFRWGELLVNGSPKGDDEGGVFKGYMSRPNQLLLGIHEKHGVGWDYFIWLDREEPKQPGRYQLEIPDVWSGLRPQDLKPLRF